MAAKKPKIKEVEGADGKITVNIFSPGHRPQEIKIEIPNLKGAANLLHRSPEYMAQAIINGLKAKYGERVG